MPTAIGLLIVAIKDTGNRVSSGLVVKNSIGGTN